MASHTDANDRLRFFDLFRRRMLVALVTLLASALWLIGILWFVRTIPVGLVFADGCGCVKAVSVYQGESHEEGTRGIRQGRVAFSIPIAADTFNFVICGDGAEVSASLASIEFFRIPALTAQNIPHFQMEKKVYSAIPKPGAPLEIVAKPGDVLNLPNVFPVVMKMVKGAVIAVAVLPLLFFLLFWFFYFCGRQMLRLLDGVLSSPSVFMSLVLIGSVLLMPNPVFIASPGLDPSWCWLLNRFAFTGVIGSEFVFTYGPLGFVIQPQLTMANVLFAMVFNGVFLIVAAWCMIVCHRAARTASGRVPVYVAAFVWVLPWSNGMEWRWNAVCVATMAFAVWGTQMDKRARMGFFVMSAVLGVVQSFVKFSNCVAVLAQQFVFLTVYLFENRRAAIDGLVSYVVAFVVSALLCILLLFSDMAAFFAWVRGSVEIASGYNLYMCAEKPMMDFVVPFLVSALVVVVWVVIRTARLHRAFLWATLAPLLFCAYKYSIVRQGVEPLLLLLAWMSMILAVLHECVRKNAIAICAICIVLLSCVRLVFCGQLPSFGFSLMNAVKTVSVTSAFKKAQAVEASRLSEVRLPKSMLEEIGTNGVMIIGADFGPAMAGDLDLIPFPATQDYSAYTAYLEHLCMARLAGDGRPVEFILAPASTKSFDSRNTCLDNLRIWYFVRDNYELVGVTSGNVLLRRRKVPRQKDPQREVMSLRYTLLERLRGLVFRVPRIMAHLRFSDGSENVFAANPATIDGVPVPVWLPRNEKEVIDFFSEKPDGLPVVVDVKFCRY